jgi:hypothetical protein
MRSDAQLVEEARRGSREAAAELFDRHWRSAWRAAYVIAGRRELDERRCGVGERLGIEIHLACEQQAAVGHCERCEQAVVAVRYEIETDGAPPQESERGIEHAVGPELGDRKIEIRAIHGINAFGACVEQAAIRTNGESYAGDRMRPGGAGTPVARERWVRIAVCRVRGARHGEHCRECDLFSDAHRVSPSP